MVLRTIQRRVVVLKSIAKQGFSCGLNLDRQEDAVNNDTNFSRVTEILSRFLLSVRVAMLHGATVRSALKREPCLQGRRILASSHFAFSEPI